MESATCIAALVHKGKVWIGGDSAASNDSGDQSIIRTEKVFSRKDKLKNTWLFGFSGAYRFGQLMRYALDLPKLTAKDEKDMVQFMVTKFVPALQACLRKHSFEMSEKGRSVGGTSMVCIRGRIFTIGEWYSVEESTFEFNAIGSGKQCALGALYASKSLQPGVRIKRALEAAEAFTTHIAAPFTILHS